MIQVQFNRKVSKVVPSCIIPIFVQVTWIPNPNQYFYFYSLQITKTFFVICELKKFVQPKQTPLNDHIYVVLSFFSLMMIVKSKKYC